MKPPHELIDAFSLWHQRKRMQVQFNYYRALVGYGFERSTVFHDMTREDVAVQHMRENHRTLCKMDGTEVLVRGVKPERLDLLWSMPDVLASGLIQAIGECHGAYQRLNEFCVLCERKKVEPFHSLNQSMTEVREFLTHLSRGYLFFLSEDEEKSQKDFEAGLFHLKRATLDMRKSVLTTIFKHSKRRFPCDLFSSIMQARQNEVFLAPHEDGKIRIYKQEVDRLLERIDWFDSP